MTKYIFKDIEISHSRFVTICKMVGVNGGRKKSHLQVLCETAQRGNQKAKDILNNLEVVKD